VQESIPLGRVADIPVSLNWTVIVILSLFAWSLATTLPHTAPGYPTADYWLAGITGSVVLLASMLAHGLSHAVTARRAGDEVSGVTLWLFGGVARLGDGPTAPAAEFRIAIAGPAVSLGVAVLFGAAAAVAHTIGLSAIVSAVAVWLATINLLLGVFNLLPGAPLDGGRLVGIVTATDIAKVLDARELVLSSNRRAP
jgi:Zn-dependent protease